MLVEDEPSLLRALLINLRARQYQVVTAGAGREALAAAARRPPDAVILDLGLPDIDGTEVIAELRRWSTAPIIVLSGRASPGDKIGALDAGADDYVTKPFSMAELLARLRAVLRRDEAQPPGPTVAVVGRCVVDLVAHTVTRRPARTPWPRAPDGTPATAQPRTTSTAADGEPRRHARPGKRSGSPRPNGKSWRASSAARASSSAPGRCSPRSGDPDMSIARTTFASTWPGCAASWRTIRHGRAICSPSRGWATGTSRDPGDGTGPPRTHRLIARSGRLDRVSGGRRGRRTVTGLP